MKCNNCGAENNHANTYCANCGSRLPLNNQQPYMNTPYGNGNNNPNGYNNGFNNSPVRKKGVSTPLIIGIAAAAIIMMAVITFCCIFFLSSKDSETENIPASSGTETRQVQQTENADSGKDNEFTAGTTCKVNDYIAGYTGLSLRAGPGKGYDRLTIVPNGAYVTVVSDYSDNDNGYINVRYNSYEGWILVSEIKSVTDTPAPAPTSSVVPAPSSKADTGDEMTVEKARNIFKNALDTFEAYYVNHNMSTEIMVQAYNKRVGDPVPYGLVQSGADSIDDVYNALHKYMSDDMCQYVIDSCYIERDGKLYHYTPVFGLEGTFVIKDEEIYHSGSKWVYKTTSAYREDSSEYGAYENSYDLIMEDGNWVVASFNEYDLALVYE